MKRYYSAGFLLVLVFFAGCHFSHNAQQQGSSSITVYHLHGKVVTTDIENGIVVVNHDAIPGFMDAMSMPYQLRDTTVANKLHSGDEITADVLVSKNSDTSVLLDRVVVVAQAKPKPRRMGYDPSFTGSDSGMNDEGN
jgi:protein SCO1/2